MRQPTRDAHGPGRQHKPVVEPIDDEVLHRRVDVDRELESARTSARVIRSRTAVARRLSGSIRMGDLSTKMVRHAHPEWGISWSGATLSDSHACGRDARRGRSEFFRAVPLGVGANAPFSRSPLVSPGLCSLLVSRAWSPPDEGSHGVSTAHPGHRHGLDRAVGRLSSARRACGCPRMPSPTPCPRSLSTSRTARTTRRRRATPRCIRTSLASATPRSASICAVRATPAASSMTST